MRNNSKIPSAHREMTQETKAVYPKRGQYAAVFNNTKHANYADFPLPPKAER